jgi:hypothetical protein
MSRPAFTAFAHQHAAVEGAQGAYAILGSRLASAAVETRLTGAAN